LSKLKLILYTRSLTNNSQELIEREQRFSNVINNVEEMLMRKTFSGSPAGRLSVSCGDFCFTGDYERHAKKEENSKKIYCRGYHIRSQKQAGFSTGNLLS
jgi:hypothetical protein